jgi:hypothetical protein
MKHRLFNTVAAISFTLFLWSGLNWLAPKKKALLVQLNSRPYLALPLDGIGYEWRRPDPEDSGFRMLTVTPRRHHEFAGFVYLRGAAGTRLTGLFSGNSPDYLLVVIPYWFPVAATAIFPLIWLRERSNRIRSRKRAAANLCTSCGYDLRASPGRCPECGATAPLAAAKEGV